MRWMSILAVFASLSYARADPKPAAPEGVQEEPKYFYFGRKNEKTPLTLDTTRLVFLGVGDQPVNPTTEQAQNAWAKVKGGLPKALAKAGIPKDKIQPNDQFFFWEVDIADRKLTEEQVEQLVARLAADEDTDFAGPVWLYRNEPGMLMRPRRAAIVLFETSVPDARARELIQKMSLGEVIGENYGGLPRHYGVRLATKNGFTALREVARFNEQAGVEFCDLAWIASARPALIPSDGGFGLQWGMRNTGQSGGVVDVDIDADEAWDLALGAGVCVLIIDDGVQRDHPDLNYDVGHGKDFTTVPPTGDGSPFSAEDNHGTAVAGVVAARLNAVGVVGAAPASFVVSAKAFRQTTGGVHGYDPIHLASAVRYALDVRARITNTSWALPPALMIETAYRDTQQNGVVHFAAAGNAPSVQVTYPASLPTVAAVGAIDRFGLVPEGNPSGEEMDFVAPGVDIYTTDRTGSDGYTSGGNSDYTINADLNGINGTSFACPHAAGVAALLLSWNRTLTPQQVIQRMRQTAVDVNPQLYGFGFDEYTGAGLINARAALNATPRIRRSDLNADGHVDSVDLTMMLGAWGPCLAPPSACDADVTGDELVNSADLTMLLGEWT